MNLSGRERKLFIALAVVVVLMGVWLVFFRPSDEPIVLPDELFPTVSPTVVASPGGSGGSAPSGSPTFVVPAGARDPFKA